MLSGRDVMFSLLTILGMTYIAVSVFVEGTKSVMPVVITAAIKALV